VLRRKTNSTAGKEFPAGVSVEENVRIQGGESHKLIQEPSHALPRVMSQKKRGRRLHRKKKTPGMIDLRGAQAARAPERGSSKGRGPTSFPCSSKPAENKKRACWVSGEDRDSPFLKEDAVSRRRTRSGERDSPVYPLEGLKVQRGKLLPRELSRVRDEISFSREWETARKGESEGRGAGKERGGSLHRREKLRSSSLALGQRERCIWQIQPHTIGLPRSPSEKGGMLGDIATLAKRYTIKREGEFILFLRERGGVALTSEVSTQGGGLLIACCPTKGDFFLNSFHQETDKGGTGRQGRPETRKGR